MRVEITTFQACEEDIRYLRDSVFGEEQGVSRALDWDGKDNTCTQVLVRNHEGDPIGTGRMLTDGKIGRLAVLKQWRGKGVGGEMLIALINEAKKKRFDQTYLHAQTHAIEFYRKFDFNAEGPEFEEAGIKHVKMIRHLR